MTDQLATPPATPAAPVTPPAAPAASATPPAAPPAASAAPGAIPPAAASAATATTPPAAPAIGSDAPAAGTDPAAPPATPPAPGVDPEWRERMAGGDKAELERLQRFSDSAAVYKWARELEKQFSSGTVKRALPENATDEQKTAWRKENGLPENAAGYEVKLPEGIVPGEADKPLIGAYQEFAHTNGMTAAQFNQNLGFYYQLQGQQQQARAIADDRFHDETVRTLTTEWGDAEFRRNENMIGNLMALAPKGVSDILLAGRTADGKRIGDHPDILKWQVDLARKIVPITTMITPNVEAAAANKTRMGELERMMGDRSSEYWRGPQANNMQNEYRQLVDAAEQARGRPSA